ncbi:MAG: YbaK/EbsC family protein [Candidatus Micrarchaeota archaeon]
MDGYEAKMVRFIADNRIKAEHLVFETSCHSVEEAADSANAKPQDFVKNVCIIDETTDELVVAIVPGHKRLDTKKLTPLIGTRRFRFATAQEILEKTGYPMGGTPSFGYKARFFIDSEVLAKDVVYSGGGSQNSLTKISPSEMLRINNATKADLTK